MLPWLSGKRHQTLNLTCAGSIPVGSTKNNNIMNYFGKISEEDFYKLREKLGTGTWDAGNGLFSYKGYVKLQGNSLRTDVISSETFHKNPITFYSKTEEEIEDFKKKFNNKRKNKFFDNEVPLNIWLELYEKHKNDKFS